jgi:hypothetical protein
MRRVAVYHERGLVALAWRGPVGWSRAGLEATMACGKRIRFGEDAIAVAGVIHCNDCWAQSDRTLGEIFRVKMQHGLVCGGGYEQD